MSITVEIWRWRLDAPARDVVRYTALLSEAERARQARFVSPAHQSRFAMGRGRLREILAGYVARAPEALQLATGANEKPRLQGGPAFNLSHSGAHAILAVAPEAADLDLGIDIEAHREIEAALPKRFFSDAEVAALDALPTSDWQLGFFQAWTRKEAVIKATGDGLLADLKGFDVSLGPGATPQVLRTSAPLPPVEAWGLCDLDLGAGLSGALAAVTGGQSLELIWR